MTSHAAVVARGWGKCCVSGCSSVRVNDASKVIILDSCTTQTFKSSLMYKGCLSHIEFAITILYCR